VAVNEMLTLYPKHTPKDRSKAPMYGAAMRDISQKYDVFCFELIAGNVNSKVYQ
jgi:hypothetical protein